MKTNLYRLAACAALAAGTLPMLAGTPLNLSNSGESFKQFNNQDVTVSGKSTVHVTDKTPLQNSKVDLQGADAWLYFDEVKPTLTEKNYLANITVDGKAAENGKTVRLAKYRGGTVIIPYGADSYKDALTVYSGAGCTGSSKSFEIETYHKALGEFDNNIRSIKLKKGFMATLANNPEGTGFSKCFIANDDDLVVDLPEGFVTKDGSDKSFVSFIRVFKWEWVSKKGWCGSDQDLMEKLNVTHYYGWDAGGPTDRIDREYTPQRHHIGWPSFGEIAGRDNVSHILGNNEPDNKSDPKEHPAEPIEVIREWPEYLKTGLRTGSPAPTSIWGSWLTDFFNLADKLNYRVDFVVYHQYEYTPDFASRVNKAVEVSKGRPVWITEWNNGANWTGENWPDSDRSASEKNQDHQLSYMKAALKNQDALDKLERCHFYNWVQDCRAVAIGGGANANLTKAGEYFRDYNSALAYRTSAAYDHKWKIAPPLLGQGWSEDFKNVKISWYDHNGETGTGYILQKKNDSGAWEDLKILTLGVDYQPGATVSAEDKVDCAKKASYRVYALAYDGKTKSANSDAVNITRDNVEEAPVLTAIATDQTNVDLSWAEVEGARSYRIERSTSRDGEYSKVAITERTTAKDSKLVKGSDYYYRIAVLSNADYEPVSEPVKVHTPSLDEAPEAVYDLYAASGDGKVSLSWTKTYRSTWTVQRADNPDGPFTTISGTSPISASTFADSNVVNGITYYYRVIPQRFELVGKPSDVHNATPQKGQLHYYPFNEGSGKTIRDYFGGASATLSSGTSWVEGHNGESNQGVALNSAKEAHVIMPNNIMADVTDFTLSIWVKPGSVNGRIFDFGSGTNNFMILDYGFSGAGKYRYKLTCSAGTVQDYDFSGPTLKKGEWSCLALSQTGSTLNFYVNGELVRTIKNAIAPAKLGTHTSNFLGKSQWSSDKHPDFAFDEMYIYNYGMSADEVKALYNRKAMTEVENLFAESDDNGLFVTVNGQDIVIRANENATVSIYSADGSLVRLVEVTPGNNVVSGLSHGIYIVAGSKVLL